MRQKRLYWKEYKAAFIKGRYDDFRCIFLPLLILTAGASTFFPFLPLALLLGASITITSIYVAARIYQELQDYGIYSEQTPSLQNPTMSETVKGNLSDNPEPSPSNTLSNNAIHSRKSTNTHHVKWWQRPAQMINRVYHRSPPVAKFLFNTLGALALAAHIPFGLPAVASVVVTGALALCGGAFFTACATKAESIMPKKLKAMENKLHEQKTAQQQQKSATNQVIKTKDNVARQLAEKLAETERKLAQTETDNQTLRYENSHLKSGLSKRNTTTQEGSKETHLTKDEEALERETYHTDTILYPKNTSQPAPKMQPSASEDLLKISDDE